MFVAQQLSATVRRVRYVPDRARRENVEQCADERLRDPALGPSGRQALAAAPGAVFSSLADALGES
ncbi:MAG: hypothetical protein JWN41_1645, partial [Thermoleophilia bacterium]|nr:hypothetical protein [Thermoleophilia bacterium]